MLSTSKPLEELAKMLFTALPANLQNLEQDLQQKFKDILNVAFTRLDLITREEFDIQAKVLARTREKLELLQLQVDTLLAEKIKNSQE